MKPYSVSLLGNASQFTEWESHRTRPVPLIQSASQLKSSKAPVGRGRSHRVTPLLTRRVGPHGSNKVRNLRVKLGRPLVYGSSPIRHDTLAESRPTNTSCLTNYRKLRDTRPENDRSLQYGKNSRDYCRIKLRSTYIATYNELINVFTPERLASDRSDRQRIVSRRIIVSS